MAGLNHLPPEILEQIFSKFTASPFEKPFPAGFQPTREDLGMRKSLFSLCLVSKHVSTVATSIMYRDIHTYDKTKLQESTAMEGSASRFEHTRTFDAVPFKNPDESATVVAFFRQLPNLRHLSLVYQSSHLALADDLSQALAAAPFKLESLILCQNADPKVHTIRDAARLRPFTLPDTLVGSLKHLGTSLSRYGDPICKVNLPSTKLSLLSLQLSCPYGAASHFFGQLNPETLLALDVMEFDHPNKGPDGDPLDFPSTLPGIWPRLSHIRLNMRCYDAIQSLPILQSAKNIHSLEYTCTELAGPTQELFAALPPTLTHLTLNEISPEDLYSLFCACRAGGAAYLPKLSSLKVDSEHLRDMVAPLPKNLSESFKQMVSRSWDYLHAKGIILAPECLDTELRRVRTGPRGPSVMPSWMVHGW